MSRNLLIICVCLALLGCTAQHNPNTLKPIFLPDLAVEYPSSWSHGTESEYICSSIVRDEFGIFLLISYYDAYDDNTVSDSVARLYEANEDVIELESPNGIRVLRTDGEPIEVDPLRANLLNIDLESELYNAADGYYIYSAYISEDHTIVARVPIVPEAHVREQAFLNMIDTARTLSDEMNVFAFEGGLTSLVYPADWDLDLRNGAWFPVFRSEEYTVAITVTAQSPIVNVQESLDADTTYDEFMSYLIETDFRSWDEVTYTNRHGTRIAMMTHENDTYLKFGIDTGIWFDIRMWRNDDEMMQETDETQLWQLVDSILLNQRDSYYAPVRLVIP